MTIADGGLRRVVQNHLAKENGWLWTPVETGTTHQGVPDSFWSHEASRTNGWVEHKATNGWAVTILPHQISWIERHVRAGVHCLIFVRAQGVGSSKGKKDSLWIIHGLCVRELSLQGLNGISKAGILGCWVGKPATWDWKAVQEILTRRRG